MDRAQVLSAIAGVPGPRVDRDRPGEPSRSRATGVPTQIAVAGSVVAIVLYLLFRGPRTLPHNEDYDLFNWLNDPRTWIHDNRPLLEAIRGGVAGRSA